MSQLLSLHCLILFVQELNVPLHWAALSGNPEVCKLLLNERTDINSINIHKETPLLVFCVVCLESLGFVAFRIAVFNVRYF